jgi:hypothetical protein
MGRPTEIDRPARTTSRLLQGAFLERKVEFDYSALQTEDGATKANRFVLLQDGWLLRIDGN